MKRISVPVILVSLCIGCGESQDKVSGSFDREKTIAACEKIIGDFHASLKQELMTAVAEGGPENAISVCNTRASFLADSFSQMDGIDIRRVSLRQRNTGLSPDDFELAALRTFAAGETTGPQARDEITLDSGQTKVFRYMKEIKVGQMCLKCHGNPESFSDPLKEALAQYYPEDPAVGYTAGESRGAFSITVTFPEAAETISSLSDLKDK